MKTITGVLTLLSFVFSGIFLTPSMQADTLNTWTLHTNGLSPQFGALRSVAFGGGYFASVGAMGVAVSRDGTNWAPEPEITGTNKSITNSLISITYGNGRFVAAGTALSAGQPTEIYQSVTSTNGTNWTSWLLPSSAAPNTVGFGNGTFLVSCWGGTENTIYTSVNGATWTAHSTTINDEITGIAYGNNTFVAVTLGGSKVYTSPDGVTWTARAAPNGNNSFVTCITFGSGEFVMGGQYGDSALFSSTNGIGWTRSLASPNYLVHDGIIDSGIGYGNGTFVVDSVGSVIISATASNQLSWALRYEGTNPPYSFSGVTYGNGLWVAVGAQETPKTGPAILTSGSLVQPKLILPITNLDLTSVIGNNGQFVATGDKGTLLLSTNGTNWSPVNSGSTNRLTAVTPSSERLVVVGNSGTILVSSDGTNWNPATSGTTNSLYGVASGSNGLVVAVGSGGTVLTSTNGTNWSRQALLETNDLTGIAFGGDQFEAASSDGTVLLSTDGTNWTTNTPALPAQAGPLVSLTYSDGEYTGLDTNGDVLTSTDGIHFDLLLSDAGGGVSIAGLSFTDGHLLLVGAGGAIFTVDFPEATTDTDVDLYAVGYNGQLYVAVGDSGTIILSSDGTDWSTPTNYLASPNTLRAITYGNGIFVGVGDGAWVVTSSDGENWTSTSSGATVEDLHGVAFGDGKFAAVGDNGVIITSTDGINWTVSNSGVTDSLLAITYANGLFVITDNGESDSLISTDGINWTPGGNGLGGYPEGVTGANGIFVSVDTGGDIYSSTDGLNWVQRAETDITLLAVTYGGGVFVAVGNGAVFVSADGINWTQTDTDENIGSEGIVAGNGQFVIVGDGGNAITPSFASLDSVPVPDPWSLVASPATDNLNGAAYNGGLYVITASSSGSDVVSSDAVNWTVGGNGLGDYVEGVTSGKGVFVSADSGGDIFASTDGVNWTQETSGLNGLRQVAYGGGTYVVTSDSGIVVTSTNHILWTQRNTGLTGEVEGIVYANGQFVIVTSDGTIAVSTNGINWTMRSSPAQSALYGVGYGNGMYVAVGYGGEILTSLDSTTWISETNAQSQETFTANTLRSVTWGNGEFVAVGDSGWTMQSVDGTNWVSSSSPTINNLHSVIFENGSFLAVGDNGTILETALVQRPELGPINVMPDGSIQAFLQGTPGQFYTIQASTDLIHWSNLTGFSLSSNPGEFEDYGITSSQPYRFYRAIVGQ